MHDYIMSNNKKESCLIKYILKLQIYLIFRLQPFGIQITNTLSILKYLLEYFKNYIIYSYNIRLFEFVSLNFFISCL